MNKRGQKIRVAIDLDGVLIDKPPIIPKWLIEWLFRGTHRDGLLYRFPKTKIEKTARWLAHTPMLRPAILENVKAIRKLAEKENLELLIISSRYGFLKERTKRWLNRHNLYSCFSEIVLNLNDEQPHIFKEKMLKKYAIDVFIDDDKELVEYLRKKSSNVKVFCLSGGRKLSFLSILSNLSEKE